MARSGSGSSSPATRARPASSACCRTRATRAGMPSVSFWAAVPHYVAQPPCPKATLALLRRLEDLLDIPVPLGDLPEEARAWERGVDELAAEDAEVARVRPRRWRRPRTPPSCLRPVATRSRASSSGTCGAAATSRAAGQRALPRRPDASRAPSSRRSRRQLHFRSCKLVSRAWPFVTTPGSAVTALVTLPSETAVVRSLSASCSEVT